MLRGRRLFARPSAGSPIDEEDRTEVATTRRLPRTPLYPRDLQDRRAESTAPPVERLLRLLRGGRYCGVAEMLGRVTAAECAAALASLIDTGHAFDRAGDALRMRSRGAREPRQRIVDLLDGLVLQIVVEEKASRKREEQVGAGFDPSSDPAVKESTERVQEDEGDRSGLLVLSEPASALSLPLAEWFGTTRAILAKRGAGKTYLAGVMLEEVLERGGGPVVVVDPMGVWWGHLSTSEGEPSPHKILLLGGKRGHLSLGPRDGAAAANVVCELRPTSLILDLSEMAPVEQQALVADFCERLWERERFPAHLIVDEADEFAPQRFGALSRHQRRSLEQLGRIVTRGRSRGQGATLISLRPAVISKNLLSQVDDLFLLRLVGSTDIRAASVWLENFEHQVTPQQRVECLSQLPVLPTGMSYFLRGGDSPMFRRFRVREKHSYDSSKTLVAGAHDNPRISSPGAEMLESARKILTTSVDRAESADEG